MSDPAPVDVKSSVPLEVKIAPESVATLDGEPTLPPVPPAAVPTSVPVTVIAPAPPPTTVVKGEGVTLTPTTTEQEDIVVGRQASIGRTWELTQSILSVLITVAVIYAELTGIQSITLGNAFFFVVSLYLVRVNHQKIGGEGAKANESQYRGR